MVERCRGLVHRQLNDRTPINMLAPYVRGKHGTYGMRNASVQKSGPPVTGCAMLKMTFADMIDGKAATQGTAFVYEIKYLHTNLHQERVPTRCLLLGW